ncbi:MAG: SDR family NAD(P)-dependent oxidoreductase [Chitinophagaceae bacterium]|nr:SDR family NAD(P)-dependent oxidoreductase [Chitinophagaceae bacterium]
MRKTYLITGASGNIGKVLAEQLLSASQKVTVIARNPEKLNELAAKGASMITGDVTNAEFMTSVLTGVDAAFLMVPPNLAAADQSLYSSQVRESYIAAVKNSGVKNVVLLSSVGAHDEDTTSIIEGLMKMEKAFEQMDGVNVLVLRPAYFMENLYWQIGTIQQMGIMGSPVRGDLMMPMIATVDIGAYAAKRLLSMDFAGKSHQYLLGSRDVSYNEVARILGKAIGKPDLAYVAFPYDQAEQAMSQMMSADAAKRMVQMAKDLSEGDMLNHQLRDATSTTPTTIEEFAQWFAGAYKGAASVTA